MSDRMNLLSIDPSLTHTACFHASGVFDVLTPLSSAAALDVRGFNVLSEKQRHAHPLERLASLRDRLRTELERCAGILEPPGLAFIEGYAFGAKCAREQLGEWGGQARLVAHELGWTVVIVPPALLKSFVCGKGNAPKEQMMLQVFKRWGYEAPDNNAADAYGLMQLGLTWLRWRAGAVHTKSLAALCAKLEPWPGRVAQHQPANGKACA